MCQSCGVIAKLPRQTRAYSWIIACTISTALGFGSLEMSSFPETGETILPWAHIAPWICVMQSILTATNFSCYKRRQMKRTSINLKGALHHSYPWLDTTCQQGEWRKDGTMLETRFDRRGKPARKAESAKPSNFSLPYRQLQEVLSLLTVICPQKPAAGPALSNPGLYGRRPVLTKKLLMPGFWLWKRAVVSSPLKPDLC